MNKTEEEHPNQAINPRFQAWISPYLRLKTFYRAMREERSFLWVLWCFDEEEENEWRLGYSREKLESLERVRAFERELECLNGYLLHSLLLGFNASFVGLKSMLGQPLHSGPRSKFLSTHLKLLTLLCFN